jgi:signal peptidase II
MPSPADAPPEPRTAGGLFWKTALTVVVLDQITKYLVRSMLPLFDSVTVIPGLLDLTYVQNRGVAFGLLNNLDLPFQGVITGSLALAALGGIVYYARHVRYEERLARLGLSLILAGAGGNLIDRFTLGFVVDFVDFYWNTWHFWAFNVADAAISVGAVLVFADLLIVRRDASDSV